jgi:hypothetical protein
MFDRRKKESEREREEGRKSKELYSICIGCG